MKKILVAISLLLAFGGAFANPSKKELFSRARDALKTSLEQQDYERSRQAIEYLKANLDEGAPLWDFEEYLALMEMGEYDEGIDIYANTRRIVLDTSYHPKQKVRVNPEDDPLHLYLYRAFSPFNKTVVDSMVNVVQNSNAKEENKELFTTLIYAELIVGLRTYRFNDGSGFAYRVIADTMAAEDFLNHAKSYIRKYSHTVHAQYLKDQVVPFVQNYMDKQREFRRDPIAHKYYTSGFGIYLGSWLGFLCGEISDVTETEMGTPFQAEVEFRVKRISLSAFLQLGMIVRYKETNSKLDRFYDDDDNDTVDETFGVTVGFTAYDSHYLRVEPFVGVGATYMPSMENERFGEYSIGPDWIIGSNVDFRFFSTNPSRIGAISTAWVLRFKYKIMFGMAESSTVSNGGEYSPKYGAVHQEFGLSLGFNLW